ncbi:MAG: glycoside hydrolase family 127 protein [Planctomycetes bacterium]|nr:glycoside hydrolase family 127 protein [Planctomycetota bacterium]
MFALGMCGSLTVAAEHDYPVRPVPFTDVTVEGGLWASRMQTNRDVTVGYDFRKCEETGRIDNFEVAGGLKPGKFQGIFFNDSDVFKVIEGASYCLAGKPDPQLDQYLDVLIAKIAAAQEGDGYLYTARTINDPNYDFPGRAARWSELASSHELYNVGHLYEAAVAHWQATGKRNLLDVALKNADLICREFGPAGQRVDVPGHQEIEMGLVKLHRATGDAKYLRQAKFFIDMRGRSDLRKTYGEYCQDHVPVVRQSEAVGHAVRAGYLYAGMTDVAALTDDAAYRETLDRIWENIVSRKMYLTGGVGSSGHGEAFGGNYDMPNETAYNETCAAIAQAYFNHRMFLLHGDGKYIDVLERILYNGFLSGVALEGDRFFYPNPLACDGRQRFNQGVLGRSPWFGCSCCPVNVVRFVPSVAGYAYASRDRDVHVNLFIEGSGKLRVGETVITLRQHTNYPWDGRVRIEIAADREAEFTLRVRIPGWAEGRPIPSDLYRYEPADVSTGWTIAVNGQTMPRDSVAPRDGFASVTRRWRAGDIVELDLPTPVRAVIAHDDVVADRGRVAFERGPLVYCLEAVDNGGSVHDLVAATDPKWRAEHREGLLGDVTVLTGTAQRAERGPDGSVTFAPATITAVPYYAWAHRDLGEMAVWVARDPSLARVKAVPTIASRSRATASHVWHLDTAEAVNDQNAPRASNDHALPRLTWWDHRGTSEWVQLDLPSRIDVHQAEVYWFDDTGHGGCRVPASWRITYRDGDAWKPVEALDEYTIAKDRFNRVRWTPVEASALRIEVQLRESYSGGVLEWRVE